LVALAADNMPVVVDARTLVDLPRAYSLAAVDMAFADVAQREPEGGVPEPVRAQILPMAAVVALLPGQGLLLAVPLRKSF